ncbi:MAG: hypothetical protein HY391_00700 [Deltaproteobacteria bacterium]|nr:hypothetical protein [Deltaproteobacteria bacterium]
MQRMIFFILLALFVMTLGTRGFAFEFERVVAEKHFSPMITREDKIQAQKAACVRFCKEEIEQLEKSESPAVYRCELREGQRAEGEPYSANYAEVFVRACSVIKVTEIE